VPTNVPQSARPSAVPPVCFVESDIFESAETARERSFDTQEDTPSRDTLFREGSGRFNQFGTMQGEVSRFELITDPGVFVADGRVQHARVEDTSPKIRQGRVLAEALISLVKRSLGLNLLETKGTLWNMRV
jgi:hypothetical protein